VKDGKVPPPEKPYPGALLNVWDETIIDAFLSKTNDDSEAA
jgi:hypothetical protein